MEAGTSGYNGIQLLANMSLESVRPSMPSRAVLLGGRIEVQSQLGRGSTFIFHVRRFGRQE